MATSANQQGVVGADSGAIWMWTEACVILRGYSPFKMTFCFVDLLRRHLFLSFYNASPLLSTFFLISPAWCYLVAQLVGISPAYISEICKAFFGEQTAKLTERTSPLPSSRVGERMDEQEQ